MNPFPRHFYFLDALRGLAALSVVFFHWPHFFYWGNDPSEFQLERLPFVSICRPLFLNGDRAVELFFCLSGFIFYWLYAEKIARRQTSFRHFFVLRFSRLYPLHFLMLIFTAITQQILLRIEGSYFILPNNDLYHFVLQLFFASNWGFERGNSFDGSVWSVSIEVLMYGLFFIICLTRFRQWWVPLVFIVAGYLLIHYGVKPVLLVGLGMMYFFLGGLAFHFFSYLRRRYSRRMLYVFVALTALLWVYAPFAQTGSWHLQLEGRFVEVRSLSIVVLLFPLTIITLAWCESATEVWGRRLAFLGDLSYSSYLIHFPLQMVFAGTVFFCGLPTTVFYLPGMFLLFFAVLIALSFGSHRYIEVPAQNYLRTQLLPPKAR